MIIMENRDLLWSSLKKGWRVYEAFLLLISILEIFMIFYACLTFDFTEKRRVVYYAAYVILLALTLISITINRVLMKKKLRQRLALANVITYQIGLVIWSAIISAMDMTHGGYPVTYMTIIAAVGVLMPFQPIFYGLFAILSSVFLFVLFYSAGGSSLPLTFFLNHFIFILVAIAVQIRNYLATKDQYLLNYRLEKQASIDGLTRVSNRRALDAYMAKLVSEEIPFSFSLMDVDNFKMINDNYGHQEGDLCLINIANVLKVNFGENVFRYGGDEFAIISFEERDNVTEKIKNINVELLDNDKDYILQICAGVYHKIKNDNERIVFERADKALYEAKQQGKARVIVFEERIDL